MKTSHIMGLKWLIAAFVALSTAATQAQTVDTYVGPASGGEWNTAANWSTLAPPLDATTNAIIFGTTNVNYNLPMATAGFGSLSLYGTLNINTNGFNTTGIFMVNTVGGEKMFINSGAVVNVTGNMQMGTNSSTTLAAGASLTVGGTLTVDIGTSSKAASTSTFTNNGGVLNANGTTINNNQGIGTGLFVINGGTNNLGNTAVGRNAAGAGGSALGTEGLVIYNGLVTMTNLNIGNAGQGVSSLSAYITGGVVTNFGSVFVNQGTSARFSRFVQTGGMFVVPDPGVVNPNPTVTGSLNNYTLSGGTNILGGFFLGNSNLLGGTINVTNSATMYIGSQGIANNGVATVNMVLNGGSMIGATAPWVGSQAMKLNGGTVTFQTADMNGAPQSITLNGALSGNGALLETGNGGLTLGAANTYVGNTTVNGSSLVLTAGGSLTSPRILLAPGSTFDVSQVSGFTLAGSQTLSGSGVVTGAVTAASGATIFPGSNSVTGTLSFTNGLTENGGVVNQFNLSSNPLGPNNDFMIVGGGLNLSGANTILISGAVNNGSAYPIINYEGNLTGGIANFSVTGAVGILSNSVARSTIYFIAQATVRSATNVLWLGNSLNNNWDTSTSTNWENAGTGLLDYFIVGDTAIFGKQGDTNLVVNIPATVSPSSVLVNSPSNYVFTGVGWIGGAGGITVSNNSVLTVLTANTYSGQTILLAGGDLSTPLLANSGSPSGIGAASSDPANLILNGGVLNYYGASVGIDHGMTLTNSGGTFDVTNGTTLTVNGMISGNGGLTLVDSGALTLTSANNYTGNTTISNGTLTLNNATGAGSGGINFAGGTLSLTTGSQPTYANSLTMLANSTLNSAGGNNNIVSGIWTGNTNMTLNVVINGTGTFSVNGNMTNFYGTVELGNDAGFFRFNAGGGNSMLGGPNTTFDLGSNSVVFEARNPGTMALGAVAGGPNTFIKGPSSTAGTLIWQIGSSTNNPNSIYYGTIQNNAGNEISSLTKVGSGTLVLAGQNTYTGTTTVNSGKLVLTNNPFTTADGSIDSSATINIVQGAGLDVSARSDGTLQSGSIDSQLVEGRGTIYGSLNAGGATTVAPGGGPGGNTGTLTVTNNVMLNGAAWMKLNRGNTPNSDQVVSSHGSITYGGTLIVTNIGSNLQVNDTFTLFSGSGLSAANFTTIVLPTYYTWDTSQLGVNGSIKVTAVAPVPALTNVDFSQLANGQITLNAIHGMAFGPVTVLTTTNLLQPIGSWTTVTSSAFDGSGNLSLPISVNPALPQSYYILLAQ